MRLKHLDVSQGSVENIDLLQEFSTAFDIAQEMDEILAQMDTFEHSFEVYHAIVNVIKEQGGVTQSLETMFGENFSSAASMEVEASNEEVGFFGKIINQVKEFFKKLWAWFQSIIKGNDGVIRALQEAMTRVDAKANIFPLKVHNRYIFENGWVNRQIDQMFLDVPAATSELQKQYNPGFKGTVTHLKDKVFHNTAADVPTKDAESDTLFGGAFTIENPEQFKNACRCLISALEALNSAKNSFGKIEKDIELYENQTGDKSGFLMKKAVAVKAWAHIRLINARVRAGAMYLCNHV